MRARTLGGASEPMAIVYRWTFLVGGGRCSIEESVAFEELTSLRSVEVFAERLAVRWNYSESEQLHSARHVSNR